MKGRLFNLCALLVAIAICGACHGKPSPKAGVAKPGASPSPPAVTKVSAPVVAQPSDAATPPIAATPTAPPSPATMAPAPAAAGAGPATSVPPTPPTPSMGVAVDGSNVYVLKDGKLYKFAKADVSECGTAVPPVPCPPCPAGAGPCSTCTSMSYIPGALSTPMATTCTPCPTTPGCPTTSSTIVSCSSCAPAPCPTTSCSPCPTPCPPCPTTRCTTYPVTSTAAGMGSGPWACPPVAGVSANTQAMVACLQDLCGADADKAYLQAMIQLNLSVLALSNASAQRLGTTTLQDYATNSISDSRSSVAQAQGWLKTKYCLDVLTCAPSLAVGLDICNIDRPGKEFDDAYKNQLVQYYVDEIALSQVELQRGLDCQVMAAAAKTIRDDQIRISRLKRCNVCI